MGKKKGGWFSAVKKALSPQSKKHQKANSMKKLTEENNTSELVPAAAEQLPNTRSSPPVLEPEPAPAPAPIEKNSDGDEINIDDEQNMHAYSVALATAAVADAAVAAAQAAAEVVRLTTAPPPIEAKSVEEISAIKIQTAFRGYSARRAVRALRGIMRLRLLIEGQSVKRQSGTTLKSMQTLARVQTQIRDRRVRMSEENLALQRQLQQKHEKEVDKFRTGGTWNDSPQSKEETDASLQSKQNAVTRRERALAYAFTHQLKKNNKNKNENLTFMDANNPQWGWSWLERCMASQPLQIRQSTSTPGSGKPRLGLSKSNGSTRTQDEDLKSIQSEQIRRHTISGASVRDDESLAGSQAVPSYMAVTRSAKAKTKSPSPLGSIEQLEQKPGLVGSTKKRLSFSSSSPRVPPRRHSVPGKLESVPVKDVPVQIFVKN